jgi:hypothetical protein
MVCNCKKAEEVLVELGLAEAHHHHYADVCTPSEELFLQDRNNTDFDVEEIQAFKKGFWKLLRYQEKNPDAYQNTLGTDGRPFILKKNHICLGVFEERVIGLGLDSMYDLGGRVFVAIINMGHDH